MEKENIKRNAEDVLNDQNLPEKIRTFPALIFTKAKLLDDLEKKVSDAKMKAENAKKMSEEMKGYEEKSSLWGKFRWKSGNTKEIVEGTQDVVKRQAEATKLNAEAVELEMKFNRELASSMEYLFYLGCYNIATNEAMIARLNEQLNNEFISNGDEKVILSSDVKEQFKSVVKRLIAQQDVLYRQERLKEKSKRHGQAIARNMVQLNALEETLKQKEALDTEQSALIEDLRKALEEKNEIDDEQSKKIDRLLVCMNEKDTLDQKQSEQIKSIAESVCHMRDEFDMYNKKQTKRIWIFGIVAIIGLILSVIAFFV